MEVSDLILFVIRLVPAVVLIAAGVAKLRAGRMAVLQAVVGYRLILGRVGLLVAATLPGAEVVVGLLLLFGIFLPIALLAAAALFAAFALAVAVAVVRGQTNDCGCFGGASRDRVRWRLVYRNLVLIALLAASGASSPALIPLTPIAPFAQVLTSALLASSTAAVFVLVAFSLRLQHQNEGGQP